MPTTFHSSRLWTHPLQRGIPPAWASEWGEDELHGPFCAFQIDEAIQRLRWIPPGSFRMEAPKDEEERFDQEGPRHLLTIPDGFWIFDTPCTQRLWLAVMGNNPSQFHGKDPRETEDHPVETVSWEDCQEFVSKLNARLKWLTLSLPSEAQWEYACRAGTETPRYRENLDEIAWYSDNSGGKTHPVASKDANAWGLYDMLGNVWEWCADVWVNDITQKARPAASDRRVADRVVRGGSRLDVAWFVRAACRSGDEPGSRGDSLGFRCAEFRAGS
jgi:formylglycine-generating enzyme required for sulfatase activity